LRYKAQLVYLYSKIGNAKKSSELEVELLKHTALDAESYNALGLKYFNKQNYEQAEKYFLKAAKVCERTSNILKGAKGENIGAVNESLLKEDLEKEVWKAYSANSETIKNLIKEERYKEATKAYGETFFEALHRFFDNVLVNAEDSALRGNRLAMMQAINKLYTNDVADLAMLPQIVV